MKSRTAPQSAHTAHQLKCHIDISIDDNCWQEIDASFREWFTEAIEFTIKNVLQNLPYEKVPPSSEIELSFLFTDDARIQILNKEYRAKNSPTNVLSFPDTDLNEKTLSSATLFGEPLTLGDVVFAEETIKREAEEQIKSLKSHFIHLAIHGILHLAGYDHIQEEEASEMENLEIQILEKMNIRNPYLINEMSKGAVPTEDE